MHTTLKLAQPPQTLTRPVSIEFADEPVESPALRYHGAKFRLAPWIMQFFPDHVTYVEPFGGAAGVLLRKPRSHGEVYNDLDGDIVNYFRVLRDPLLRERLVEALALTPYSREEFMASYAESADCVERARSTAIRSQMGFGSAGATMGKTGFRIDAKRPYSTAQHVWDAFPDTLAILGKRLRGVLIENRPAISVMLQHDSPATLHYVDPPYMMETRGNGTGTAYYRHEMSNDEHSALLLSLRELKGMVILSGYDTPLYANALHDWASTSTASQISSARGSVSRTETIWLNPACTQALTKTSPDLLANC